MIRILILAILFALTCPAALAQDNRNTKLSNDAAERTAVREEHRQNMASKQRFAEEKRRIKEREGSKQSGTKAEKVSDKVPAKGSEKTDADSPDKDTKLENSAK
jgi:hypothetical protein